MNPEHQLRFAEIEAATIKAFVAPNQQDRFLGFVGKAKTRKKFLEYLNHFVWFDPRFSSRVPWKVDPKLKLWEGHLQGIANIHRLLLSKGAVKTCWAISANGELDGRELELEWALPEAMESEIGTILSCIPGKLAIYLGEHSRLLLSK